MIIPALIKYYERLEADPDQDIAPLGFSRQKISFCVTLNSDGTLEAIEDMRRSPDSEWGSGKPVARQLVVPGQAKSSGQGINPCFLWDNAAYTLGFKPEDPKPERTRACFEAFRDRHLSLRKEINDELFDAVCAFLKQWNPDSFSPDTSLTEYLVSFGVYRVLPEQRFVHERQTIKDWWTRHYSASDGVSENDGDLIPSLTTGRPSRIARLHEPAIKGVAGAQSSGARLVSFNEDAFESYGKSQGMNAPVAEEDAFKYCTALSRLLDDRSRRTGIGDATVVWWSDQPEAVGEAIAGAVFGTLPKEDEPTEAEDALILARVRAAVSRIVSGLAPDDLADSRTPFHVLGLSPNAARLSVRFWWDGTLAEMTRHIASHHADLRLEPVPPQEAERPFSIRRIVMETARQHGAKPDADTVSPNLAGEVARAIITGAPYPMSLLEAVIRRVRADARVTHARCAIVKACITRRRRILAGPGGKPEEIPVSLNKDGPAPYQLGRLFAVLESTQLSALGDLNATIKDRYFGSASATPALVFPRLLRLHQHHVEKLPKTAEEARQAKKRTGRTMTGIVTEIVSKITKFPRHLNIEDQGLFQIGYYHQRQDMFTKSDMTSETESTQES
ncbi:MAG: type I-C CRISPR-associated protein Cas8c/Csd1 [Phycisphaeraceae bacterium]|nr:type I-C CRISPR-associated protein Cas8c/Csd1 [Phycisphaeraceae bacterium]MCW5769251.1 type I-C CRISPR-associated protein Cas8c/Csd1 [Phycisphaeraceae bacterium]